MTSDSDRPRFKWPGDSDRICIVGMVGTGKTRAAVHQLSHRSIDSMTWIAMDFKGDDTLAAMPVTDIMDLGDPIPSNPGLYYVKVEPSRRGAGTTDFFKAVYDRGECGVLVDETLAIGAQNEGFNICLFMGRSRRVPMIMLMQRPVGMEVNARNQATFWQVFRLGNRKDRDALRDDIPEDRIDLEARLPLHHSHWYDVARDYAAVLKPTPDESESFARIQRRMFIPDDEPAPEDSPQQIPRPAGRRVKL